ncbi:MAG TPA: OmpW family outer membrane protein [Methyloceanibacter sp.]|jgi:outer membrane protein|nr:OmpW family outer membrane protein [Methyloceanibacter sp.]
MDFPAGPDPAIPLRHYGQLQALCRRGGSYIDFFDTGTGANVIGATKVDIDDAWGFTLQAGVDVSLGNGWSLNADVKKTWLDTTVTWRNAAAVGGVNVVGDADVDPWIFSAGLGYRFNLGSIFGHGAEAAPIK